MPSSSLIFLIFATVLLISPSRTSSLSLRFLSRSSSLSLPSAPSLESLENTCQCDCCYFVGSQGRTECVPPIDTSFDVPKCSKCDVETCSKHFPIACAQQYSIVTSECVQRKGWMLRLIPALFLVITVSLLVYGLFIKTFDGYHDDRHVQPPTVLPHLPSVSYNTFGTYSNTYQTSADINQLSMDSVQRVRSSSSLPPIIETEIPEDSTDESVSKKSSPVLEPIPEFAAVGVANSASALTAMEDVQVDVDACAQEDVRTAELIGEPSQHVHDPSVTVAGLRGIVEKGNDGGKEGAEHV